MLVAHTRLLEIPCRGSIIIFAQIHVRLIVFFSVQFRTGVIDFCLVSSQEYSCLHSYDPGVLIIAQIQPRGIYHCPVTTRDIHMITIITTQVSFSFNSYDQGILFEP